MAGELIKLTDADKGVDFTKVINGHVSHNLKNQRFTIKRTRACGHKKLKLEMLEHIVQDQFGNLYVVFISKLMDQEVYSCTAWVGSEKWDGTQKTTVLVKEWKKFKTFNDELLACFQNMAAYTFAKHNLQFMKGALAAKTVANVITPDFKNVEAGTPLPSVTQQVVAAPKAS